MKITKSNYVLKVEAGMIDLTDSEYQELSGKKTIEWGECSDKEMTWYEAKKWCEAQGGRLPTRAELIEAIDTKVGGFKGDYFWSSTKYNSSAAYAWLVNLVSGYTTNFTKTTSCYVRWCK